MNAMSGTNYDWQKQELWDNQHYQMDSPHISIYPNERLLDG